MIRFKAERAVNAAPHERRVGRLDIALYLKNYLNMKLETAVTGLAALAQDTRLQIFRLLVRAHAPQENEGGLAAGELAVVLGVSPATLSFHLKDLAHAGLVSSRREGRSIIYKANFQAMRKLTDFLLEDCCQGSCGSIARAKDDRQEQA